MRALAIITVLTAGLLVGTAAHATVVDPTADPQIFVQQSGTAPAGGDPNIITDTSGFVIGVAGNFVLQDPLLVGVAVYDGSGTPSISYSGCTDPLACPVALVGTYGITTNSLNFTSGDLYNQLGFTQAGGSISYQNLSDADMASGLAAPTSFMVDLFQLPVNLTSGSPITVDEMGAAIGSFVFAFGCEDGTGTNHGCINPKTGKLDNGNIGQTVMTNIGEINLVPVPEPGSLAILGAGLLGLGILLNRRRKNGLDVNNETAA